MACTDIGKTSIAENKHFPRNIFIKNHFNFTSDINIDNQGSDKSTQDQFWLKAVYHSCSHVSYAVSPINIISRQETRLFSTQRHQHEA